MARRLRSLRPESGINVTPMADVSLSLLLGFLVITPVIFETLSATLPQGAGAASGEVKQNPIVEFTAEGKILFDGDEITEEELPAKLDERFPRGKSGERKVMFTGAGEVPYEDVIYLLDLLRKHGVETIGIR